MKREKPVFRGSATALITPFSGGHVDYRSLKNIIERQISQGTDALVLCGTTGEAATLSDGERENITAFAVETAEGRVPVIAGTGSNDISHAARNTETAERLGADAALVITPYYNKTSQKGLTESFKVIAGATGLPVIIYNVPPRTGMTVEPETYAELAEIPNITGIKDAEGDFSKSVKTASLISGKLDIYAGNDDRILPMLSLGAAGVISVLSNIKPFEVHELTRLFFEGHIKESTELQLSLVPLISALFSDVNPIPVKEAMAALGYCSPELRLPLVGMSADKRAALLSLLGTDAAV